MAHTRRPVSRKSPGTRPKRASQRPQPRMTAMINSPHVGSAFILGLDQEGRFWSGVFRRSDGSSGGDGSGGGWERTGLPVTMIEWTLIPKQTFTP